MEVVLLENSSQQLVKAQLLKAQLSDMKTLSDGWRFNWLYQYHKFIKQMKATRNTKIVDEGLIGDELGFDTSSKSYSTLQKAILENYKNQSEEDKLYIALTAVKCKMIEYLDDEQQNLTLVGEFLKQCLQVIRIKQNVFAAYIGWNPGNFTKLLKGTRKINYEMAVILGKTFEIEPTLWLRVQDKNEFMQISKASANRFSGYSLKKLYEFAAVL